MARIVGYGSMSFDIFLPVPRLPVPNETLTSGPTETFAGGKVANQAVAAARMGVPSALVGVVGDDEQGRFLRSELAALGVDAGGVRHDPSLNTGLAIVMVAPGGRNMIVVSPGANIRLNSSDIDLLDRHPDAELVLIQPADYRPEVLVELVERTAALGLTLVLNNAPAVHLPATVLASTSLLVVNEAEAGDMVGRSVHSVTDAMQAASDLQALGARNAIVTLGRQGSVVALQHADKPMHMPALPVTAIDSTAAGDCFIGVLAARWLEAGDLLDAVRWGTAAAAVCVTRLGSMRSLPERAEVTKLLADQPTTVEGGTTLDN